VVGQILGGEGINIAGMQVSRDTRGGHALIVLTIDSAIPPVVLEDITATIGAVVGRTVDLDMNWPTALCPRLNMWDRPALRMTFRNHSGRLGSAMRRFVLILCSRSGA